VVHIAPTVNRLRENTAEAQKHSTFTNTQNDAGRPKQERTMSTTAEQSRVKRKALIAEIIDAYEHHADDSQSFREEARGLLIAHEDEYFKTVVTSLAEEAERVGGEVGNYQQWIWQIVAAWLRHKAEERSI
jgi:hypothetical protein